MKKVRNNERVILKTLLWVYIILCLLIAGLNYAVAPRADAAVAKRIAQLWHFYENEFKTGLIVVAGILTFRIISTEKRFSQRKTNLIGFFATALVVHILLPYLTGNPEIYFFVMPLPWTTTPLQLLNDSSAFAQSRTALWGAAGVTAALAIYVAATVLVFAGTLLLGRRWQCSTLCLFNGFVSENFSTVTPLIGKKRLPVTKTKLALLSALRWIFFGISVVLALWWVAFLSGISMPGSHQIVSRLELIKYLGPELLMAMFFWVAFLGRGYCYYCSLGTTLSLLARLAGQQIETDKSECIGCGQCSKTCPMSIDVMAYAQKKVPVTHNRCVGCGHCVDACPTKTLLYSTRFLRRVRIRTL
jgi:polyferredoxin